MLVLGISGGLSLPNENKFNLPHTSFHDSAAAIVKDGKVVCAIEEERLDRIKHSNKAPLLAIKYCLESAGISLGDIDRIAISNSKESLDHPLKEKYVRNSDWHCSFDAKEYYQDLLSKTFDCKIDAEKIAFVPHHVSHATSAFAMSGYDKSLVITIDGIGDGISGLILSANNEKMDVIDYTSEENSLGIFYIYMIHFLGYGQFDEYKVMGLAPYGNPEKYMRLIKKMYTLLPDGKYTINTKYLSVVMDMLGARRKGEPFSKKHMDFAAALQIALETIIFHMLEHYKNVTGHTKLCLAGGVAHNCSFNGKLLYSGMFDDIFVQPAAHDAGGAIGAALNVSNMSGDKIIKQRLKHTYWGTDVNTNDVVESTLTKWNGFINYHREEDIVKSTAKLISEGSVIGWVQGRSEFGPRALGNRSILADPRPAENKDIINAMVKKREAYRPFAPSIMQEYLNEYYIVPHGYKEFPFMNFVLKTVEDKQKLLGAVTHVDGTARVQTVSKSTNLKYWSLIEEFRKLTDIPILLNTSFNNNAEPIIDSESDAIVCFLTTELNYLVIGDYLISKKEIDCSTYLNLVPSLPLHAELVHKRKYISSIELVDTYEIEFNISKKFSVLISEQLFKILTLADGRKTLHTLIDYQNIEESNTIQRIIEETNMLWKSRHIVFQAMTNYYKKSNNREEVEHYGRN